MFDISQKARKKDYYLFFGFQQMNMVSDCRVGRLFQGIVNYKMTTVAVFDVNVIFLLHGNYP